MTDESRTRLIPTGTAASRAFAADVERAMAITPVLNRLTFADLDEVRALFGELTGREVGRASA